MSHAAAPFSQPSHPVSKTQLKAQIPTNTQDHDFLVEVPTFEQFLDRYESRHLSIIPELLVRLHQSPAEDLRIQSKPVIVGEVDDGERARKLLTRAGIPVTVEGGRVLRIHQGEHGPAHINAMLVREGVAVSHLTTKYPTLEDAFLELTNSATPEKEAALANDA